MGSANGHNKLSAHRMPGTLYVVATPIGNLEDVTARALRVLQEVAVIAAEDTRPPLICSPATPSPRRMTCTEHNETRKTPAIAGASSAAEDVALVSDAGHSAHFRPRALTSSRPQSPKGYESNPFLGPSAIVTALSAAGASTGTFTFLGFPRLGQRPHIVARQPPWHRSRGRVLQAPHRDSRDTSSSSSL